MALLNTGSNFCQCVSPEYVDFSRPKAEGITASSPEQVMAFALFGANVLVSSSMSELRNVLTPLSGLGGSRSMDSSGYSDGCGSCDGGSSSGCGGSVVVVAVAVVVAAAEIRL